MNWSILIYYSLFSYIICFIISVYTIYAMRDINIFENKLESDYGHLIAISLFLGLAPFSFPLWIYNIIRDFFKK